MSRGKAGERGTLPAPEPTPDPLTPEERRIYAEWIVEAFITAAVAAANEVETR